MALRDTNPGCVGDGFFFASLVLLRLPFHIIAMPDCGAHSAKLALLASLPISVHVRKFNLLMLHCLKRGFPSYVDASRQEGTILNGDARDYDVSTQGALAANIKVITCFTATNYLAEHYDLPRCDI